MTAAALGKARWRCRDRGAKFVPLRDIDITKLRMRAELDPEQCQRLAQLMLDGTDIAAIELAEISGRLLLLDGAHRIDAAKSLGIDLIPALVEEMTLPAATVRAAVVNQLGPTPLVKADRERAVAAIIRADPTRSDPWIATAMGRIHYTTVGRIRRRLKESSPEVAPPVRMATRGGTTYPIRYGKRRQPSKAAAQLGQLATFQKTKAPPPPSGPLDPFLLRWGSVARERRTLDPASFASAADLGRAVKAAIQSLLALDHELALDLSKGLAELELRVAIARKGGP